MATDWREVWVADLHDAGALLVEDGNHGEYRPRPQEFVGAGVPFIRAADLDGGRIQFASASRISEAALRRIRKGIGAPGDVVLSHKGTVGKVAFARLDCEPFVCSPQTTFWRVLDPCTIDRRYLYYYLCSRHFREQLDARKGETDMADYVSLTAQRALRVLLPPLPEQRAIARVLGPLDDKIDLNRRMNKTLEAIAQAIFKSWFVDFDPVRAKAEGRPPAGMDAATAALFPDSFRESALGKAPAGWAVGSVDRIATAAREVVDPAAHPDEVFDHYSIPAYDEDRRPVTEAGARIGSSKLAVPPGAVLLSRLNPQFPRVWMPTPSAQRRAICSTEFLVASPLPGYSREYLYGLFTSGAFGARLSALVTGTSGSHQRVRPDDVLAMLVVVPQRELVGRFTDLTHPLHELAANNRAECVTLASIRDALLPKLIGGEIRVKGPAQCLEGVAV